MAVNEGATKPLTDLVNQCLDPEVRRLSCEALASLAMLMVGRQSIAEAGGLQALTTALVTTPEAAAGALKVRRRKRAICNG